MFTGLQSFGDFINAAIPSKFEDYFRCYPISRMAHSKEETNYGGKIFLPPSALDKLTRLHISYPMLFELRNDSDDLMTHSGVLEFTAEEGRAYIPNWMMKTLKLEAGELIKICSCDLPLGRFVKIEPQSVDFLDISNPKAVLEKVLRNFSTLTVDDIIEVKYNDTIYGIKVLEAKPESENRGICVIETDLETDFAPPVGYVEPDYKAEQAKKNKEALDKNGKKKIDTSKVNTLGSMALKIGYTDLVKDEVHGQSNTFGGIGNKLSGMSIDSKLDTKLGRPLAHDTRAISLDGPPKPLILNEGQLFFGFPLTPPPESAEEVEKPDAEVNKFQGMGKSLREPKKRKGNGSGSKKTKVRSPGSTADDPMEID